MCYIKATMFKKRENVQEIEEGDLLSPKFDNDGLIPVVTTCFDTKEILMHGYMNVEAFKLTIETKEAHYWSRSRKSIWHKGKTSGFVQKVKAIRIDDDQDAVWLTVDIGKGSSCHVGYRSCFYRSVPLGKIDNAREIKIKFEEKEDVQKKSHFEIKFSTIVKIEEDIKEKNELEKILLCDVQEEISPEIQKSFLNLLHNSGYPGFEFEKKLNFQELYKQKTN